MNKWGTTIPAELWERLGLFFDSDQERERWIIPFYINSTPVLFHNWLENKIYYRRGAQKPVAKLGYGEILLNHLQIEHNDILKIWVQGIFVERTRQPRGPDTITNHYLGTIVAFKALLLGTQRTEVTASCHSPRALAFYKMMLGEIAQAWPESSLENRYGIYREGHPMVPRRSANAERDEEIFYWSQNGKTRQMLAEEYHLTEYRIKQIVKEQREKQAG